MNDHPKFRKTTAGELLLNFGDYGREIEVATFSGDGRRLLTVEDVRTAHIWDTDSRALLAEIKPTSPLDGTKAGPSTDVFRTFIESAALNADGSRALLGLNDGSAGVFSTESGERLSRMREPRPEPEPCEGDASTTEQWELIRAVCFSRDGTRLGVGHFNRCVSIWDGTGERCLNHLRPPSSQRLVAQGSWPRDTLVSSVSISADNRHVFVGSADGTACIWDLETETTVLDAVEHAASIIDLFVADDCVRWSTSDGTVWEADRDLPPRKVLETGQNWRSTAFSPSGEYLLTRSRLDEIDRWSLDGSCERLAVISTAVGAPQDVLGRLAQRLSMNVGLPLRDDLGAFEFGNHENKFCYVKTTTSLVLTLGNSSTEIQLDHRFDKMLLSAEHHLLVTEGWADQVELWSFPDGRPLGVLACPGGVVSLALSHDGSLLACGASGSGSEGDTSPIRIFRVPDGQLLTRLEGHTHQVHGLAFAPNDEWLISTSLDRSVRKWDLGPGCGSEMNRIVDEELEFHHLNVLSDGRVLLCFRSRIEVWNGLDERLLEIPAVTAYRSQVVIPADERRILITYHSHIDQWSLVDGSHSRRIRADLPRPLSLPSDELQRRIEAKAGAHVWQYSGQNFIHLGDGPRGWVTPLSLSVDGQLIALPCADGAAIVKVDERPQLISTMPFEGQLRGSWLTAERAWLVNSAGQLFSWNPTTDHSRT